MSEELAEKLIEALNRHSTALEKVSSVNIKTRQELQKELGLGNETMQKIFEDPNFKAQRMGRKDFATVEAIHNYFTNYRHERN